MACIDLSLTEETHDGQRNSVWNSSSRRQCRRRGRRLQHRPKPLAGHGTTRTGTRDIESASATGRRSGQVARSKTRSTARSTAAVPSGTTSWTWSDQNRHEGHRICVGNRSSRRPGRRRGRRLQHCPEPPADHGLTRTGTKDSKTGLGTGLRGRNVKDEVHGCSTIQDAYS